MTKESEFLPGIRRFFQIYFEEYTKGNYIPNKFAECFSEIKKIDKKFSKNSEKRESKYYQEKINALAQLFYNIQNKIYKEKLDIKINIQKIKNKDTYTIDLKDEALFFALKFVQKDIQKSFKVKQSNRDTIVEQIINLIDDDLPKFILRLDIKNFYETIPHDKLKKMINENYILEPMSKKLIFSILKKYNQLSKNKNMGIPRRIGISAYLSELYMRDFDKNVKNLEEVVYYARYVDDIIIISTCNIENNLENLLENIKLNFHNSESKKRNLIDTSEEPIIFDFLGYSFFRKNKDKLIIGLSKNKIKKYKDKIEESIKYYNEQSKYNEKEARIMLKKIKIFNRKYSFIWR